VFETTPAPGEQIDIEPGRWLYKDPGLNMETNIQLISTDFLASMNLVTNRFTGSGRTGIQLMYLHMPSSE
jgi:uncharacterized protein (AIM24 family)